MRTLIHAGLYAFGGAAWTFLALRIQEHFFWPENLTPRQKQRLDSAKWWLTLMGAIAGLLVSAYSNQDATAHAEMLALTQAQAAVGDWRLTDCDLYVTKEPCPMCAGALVHTRIRRVIFGCTDPSAGAAGSVMILLQMPILNHRCDVASGVLQDECAAILQNFFRKRRPDKQIENQKPEIGT